MGDESGLDILPTELLLYFRIKSLHVCIAFCGVLNRG